MLTLFTRIITHAYKNFPIAGVFLNQKKNMFTLKIHTIDFPQQLHTTVPFAAINGDDDVKPAELMGVAHLFRQLPITAPAAVLSTVANISIRTTLVFVVAVPNYMSADGFLIFCGPTSPALSISSSSGTKEWRIGTVLIWLENQLAANGFYCSFNGKRFKPSEAIYTASGPTCLARFWMSTTVFLQVSWISRDK